MLEKKNTGKEDNDKVHGQLQLLVRFVTAASCYCVQSNECVSASVLNMTRVVSVIFYGLNLLTNYCRYNKLCEKKQMMSHIFKHSRLSKRDLC